MSKSVQNIKRLLTAKSYLVKAAEESKNTTHLESMANAHEKWARLLPARLLSPSAASLEKLSVNLNYLADL